MTDLLNINPIYIFLVFLVIGLFIFFIPKKIKMFLIAGLIIYVGIGFYLQPDIYSKIKSQPTIQKQADCLKQILILQECSRAQLD